MGTGNHVGGDDFAQAGRGSAAGLDGGLHSADIAAHHDAHQAGSDFLRADEGDVGRFHHGVGGFDSGDQAAGFYHS